MKREISRLELRTLSFSVFLVAACYVAHGQTLALSPQATNVGSVLPGASFVATLTASNLGTDPLLAQVSFAGGGGSVTSINPSTVHISSSTASTVQVTVSAVAPTTLGYFQTWIRFTYYSYQLHADLTADYLIAGTVATQSSGGTSGPPWVGVIPQDASCPPGVELMTIHMDDEDHDNENSRGGWIGGITSDRNTTFRFCKVDGSVLKPLTTGISASHFYAVLRLAGACPDGAVRYARFFDNENSRNDNWSIPATLPGGNSADQGISMTYMEFCLFKNSTSGDIMPAFPSLGFQYGVLAAPGFAKAVESGWLYTDDENAWGSNANDVRGDSAGLSIVAPTGNAGRNTTIYVARVTEETRPVARCTVSPSSGIYSVDAYFSDNGSYARGGRTITSYLWTFSDLSPSVEGPGPHYRYFSSAYGYSFSGTLTVTDNFGETSSSDCFVTVSPGANCAPSAFFCEPS